MITICMINLYLLTVLLLQFTKTLKKYHKRMKMQSSLSKAKMLKSLYNNHLVDSRALIIPKVLVPSLLNLRNVA